MKQFEYNYIVGETEHCDYNDRDYQVEITITQLDEVGAEGWEVVMMTPDLKTALLKRER